MSHIVERITLDYVGALPVPCSASPANGELYGFARTQAISNQPAHAIAEAARQFGQEDDITVLSVVRNAG